MLNLNKCQSAYSSRQKQTIGYTCILKYNHILKLYTDAVNQKISTVCGYYEAYDKSLHMTLLGLDPAESFENDSDIIVHRLQKIEPLYISELQISLKSNGLVIIEMEVDEDSKYQLKKYRQQLENDHKIFYKYQQNITKLHSVIGLLN